MKAIDTNVVVRLIARDDPVQLEQAQRLLESEECFIADTVLLETAWVLRSSYDATRKQVYTELMAVLGLPTVRVFDPERIRQALEWYADGLDIADALHLAAAQGADAFVTFDRKMIDRARDRGACPVVAPAA